MCIFYCLTRFLADLIKKDQENVKEKFNIYYSLFIGKIIHYFVKHDFVTDYMMDSIFDAA